MQVPPPVSELIPRIRGGVNAWIAQTFIQLRRRGLDVSLGPEMEHGSINVIHFDDLIAYYRPYLYYVVGVRCDRSPLEIGDRIVVQSPVLGCEPRATYIPNWPQPGLIPRSTSRGNRCDAVGFVGRPENLDDEFRSTAFAEKLRELGLTFIYRDERWDDFSDIDLFLAVRTKPKRILETKPPSKLVNAWQAGVPAVLGPEPPFEAIRQSEHDFIPASNAEEAIRAIARLRANASLRNAMIENGRRRAAEFTEEAIASRWIAFFRENVFPHFVSWQRGGKLRLPERFCRFRLRRRRERRLRIRFKQEVAVEQAKLAALREREFQP